MIASSYVIKHIMETRIKVLCDKLGIECNPYNKNLILDLLISVATQDI